MNIEKKSSIEKVFGLIGLAQRSGRVSSGREAVVISLNNKKAKLLIISTDIAVDTKKDLLKMCTDKKIPWIELGDRLELGKAIGKELRVAVTINDLGFKKSIIKQAKELQLAESMGVDEWRK